MLKIIAALGSGDAFLLHLQDRNVGEYWRAVIGVKARLVTVSATGTDEIRLDPAEGRKILEKTLDALRAANKPPHDALARVVQSRQFLRKWLCLWGGVLRILQR